MTFFVWIGNASSLLMLGFYHGLLATLPMGPSQILCVRAFFIEGRIGGITALIGSMMGQFLLFSAILYSPLYLAILKPHIATIAVIPYMFFYWFETKNLPDYQVLRPIRSIRNLKIVGILLNSFLFQILNPILLPNPALARLLHLFLFRYSNNPLFLTSSFLGWLIGHVLFGYSANLLVLQVEKNSTIPYPLTKRIIHKTFSIIFFIKLLLCLGRAPVAFLTRKFQNELISYDRSCFDLPSPAHWLCNPWPASFFDPNRTNRALRYRKKSRRSDQRIVKKRQSTYFFDKCLVDGKPRLYFTSLSSASIFGRQLEESLKNFDVLPLEPYSYQNWILDQARKRENLQNELRDRIKLMELNSILSEAIEQKIGLRDEEDAQRTSISKIYDPLSSKFFRVRIPAPQSFLTTNDLIKPITDTYRNYAGEFNYKNRIANLIYSEYTCFENSKIPLPWEDLSIDAIEVLLFTFNELMPYKQSFGIGLETIVKRAKNFSPNKESPFVTWEEIFKLLPMDRALFLLYLEETCGNPSHFRLSNISLLNRVKSIHNLKRKKCLIHRVDDLERELFQNIRLMFDNRFDLAGAESDVRNKRLRNLAISIGKTNARSVKLVKRYTKSSDFRRKLIKGSMRARRRKTLIWEFFQGKAHSPFFMRLMEIPVSSYPSVKESIYLDYETLIDNTGKKLDIDIEQTSKFPSPQGFISRSKYERLGIAARLDVGPIHTGRGLLLVAQSNFRRYIKLPVLIALKNIGRILLFQRPEWFEDWIDLCKETHIICSYDGEEYSQTRFPGRWLKEGIQIKILFPFRLKPWHNQEKRRIGGKIITEYTKSRNSDTIVNYLNTKKAEFTYLTAWGFQTDLPFGTIKEEHPFWKPIRVELMRMIEKNIFLRTRQAYHFLSKQNVLAEFVRNLANKLNFFYTLERTSGKKSWKKKLEKKDLVNSKFKRDEYFFNEKPIDKEVYENSSLTSSNNQSYLGNNEKRMEQKGFALDVQSGMNTTTPNILLGNRLGEQRQDISQIRSNEMNLYGPNLIGSLRLEKELVGIGEKLLKLHELVIESMENCAWYIRTAFRDLYRIIVYFLIQLATLQTQLLRAIDEATYKLEEANKSNLKISDRYSLLTIGNNQSKHLLSHAYLYEKTWRANNLDLTILLDEDAVSLSDRIEGSFCVVNETNWNEISELDVHTQKDSSFRKSRNIISTNNLENPATHKYKYFDERIKIYGERWGLTKSFQKLTRNDWKIWLDRFERYNVPMEVWHRIAPYRWRTDLSNLKKLEEIDKNILDEHSSLFCKSKDDYSIYTENPLLKDRIRNLNKRRRFNYFLENLVDYLGEANVDKFVVRRNGIEQGEINSQARLEYIVTSNGKKNIVSSLISNPKIKWDLRLDLALWSITDITRRDYDKELGFAHKFEKSILTKKYGLLSRSKSYRFGLTLPLSERFFQNQIPQLGRKRFINRESFSSKLRWRFRSKKLQRKLEKLREVVSIVNVIGKEQNITSFYGNIMLEPDLLNVLFTQNRRKVLSHLFFNAHPRRPKVFDDQILMYKMVSTLLKFRGRLKKSLDNESFNVCLLPFLEVTNEKDSSFCNIEDFLLPRRRRQLRFLESLPISKSTRFGSNLLNSIFDSEEIEKRKIRGNPMGVQRIKRFLWPDHRLEDLACINRFCFGTANGSRFSALRIRMYPIIED
uniref:Protein TIC 214 n=1 Tax=Lygodium japonicum TaxID=13824 RepID=S4UFV2_LYGJA|nr:conserved hypothetical protein Ycf1 [Lygodium japonicum]AGI51452.1 conserved hypothetical protein Ycf1 [Lygodium japonicum]